VCGSPSVRPAASLPGAATQQRLEPGPMRSCAFVDEPLAFVRFVLVVVIAGARWRPAGGAPSGLGGGGVRQCKRRGFDR